MLCLKKTKKNLTLKESEKSSACLLKKEENYFMLDQVLDFLFNRCKIFLIIFITVSMHCPGHDFIISR